MKNFPSALIKQKNTKGGIGNNLGTTLKNIGTQALSNILGGSKNIDINDINSSFERGYERLDVQHEIDSFNINNYSTSDTETNNDEVSQKIHDNSLSNISLIYNINNGNTNFSNFVKFEDPFLYSSSLFDSINNYKYILKTTVPSIYNHLNTSTYKFEVVHSVVSPSLFNPYNGVNFNYITEKIPLVNNSSSSQNGSVSDGLEYGSIKGQVSGTQQAIALSGLGDGINNDVDITDCSIKHLVEISSKTGVNNMLGLATYRYIDFMYCKDLGKISNNHLITLRKFGHPIGDNIFQEAVPDGDNQKLEKSNYDIGRLITWFDNEDNKLEDICKYNYNASWKEFKAAIQQVPSSQKEGSSTQLFDLPIDKIANAFSASNNQLVAEGKSANYGLLQWTANKLNIPILGGKNAEQYYNWDTLTNYDQNRIYEPQDTIWDTHKYEGKLTFNQEITLVFRYTLRSYANINPKSALLDLIGNIMTVTYRRGEFWGGQTKIYGPQANNSVYDTTNAFIDKSFDKLGGIWRMLREGSLTPEVIKGWLGNIMDTIQNVLGTAGNAAMGILKDAAGESKTALEENAVETVKEKGEKVLNWLEESNKMFGWSNAIKGMLKNQLGRPAIYAVNSLLTGEAVGPWHLTIGNPLNPIMSMGNMIMTNSEVQHLGPLGLDDFPTEIKVTVQLKHGRPRDSVEIQKMYTKGRDAIYKPMNLIKVNDYFNNFNAFPDILDNSGKHKNQTALNKLLRTV